MIFLFLIPLMAAAVALAATPLVIMSIRDHRSSRLEATVDPRASWPSRAER